MSFPTAPQLTLRLGVAGKRSIPLDREQSISSRLRDIFSLVEEKLLTIWTSQSRPQETTTRLYDTSIAPKLRLVTGLADGADQLAARAFLEAKSENATRELAAVLPFASSIYRERSPIENKLGFDELAARCVYVLELDGVWRPKDTPDAAANSLAGYARARAYRQQAAILMRQCDLLIVVGEYEKAGRPGGTQETSRLALGLGIPVAWIEAGRSDVRLFGSVEEWTDYDPSNKEPVPPWQAVLQKHISDLVANPLHARHIISPPADWPQRAQEEKHDEYRDMLLKSYFDRKPPAESWRQTLWEQFERRIAPSKESRLEGIPIDHGAAADYRRRAAELSRHFVGKYRGAFLLNYNLAAFAVTAATVSLTLMVLRRELTPSLWGAVFVLAVLEIIIVAGIFQNTRAANQGGWSEIATDFRYLSERLRPLTCLAPLGGLRPPATGTEQYATRVEKQSSVDWLADAIIRGMDPLRALRASGEENIVRLDAAAILGSPCVRWIDEQLTYHRGNSERMRKMNERLEGVSTTLIKVVISFICVDVLLLLAYRLDLFPVDIQDFVRVLKAILIGSCAVIPAFVASMNGIRFQSECQRIADRSAFMTKMLRECRKAVVDLMAVIREDRARGVGAVGSWTIVALMQIEMLAKLTVEEAAEWSVLYAKHMFES
jgi:hypothetical protein